MKGFAVFYRRIVYAVEHILVKGDTA